MPVFLPEKSKIKMVILTKNKSKNRVWWSPIKQNKRPNKLVIQGMLNRFKKSKWVSITNVIQFYENGNLIEVIKL